MKLLTELYCCFATDKLYSPQLPTGNLAGVSQFSLQRKFSSPKANIAENTVIVVSQLRCFHGTGDRTRFNQGFAPSSRRERRSSAPHLDGFESCCSLAKNKRETYASLLFLVRMTGLEPARFWRWNLNPMSLPIPPHPHIRLAILPRECEIVKFWFVL